MKLATKLVLTFFIAFSAIAVVVAQNNDPINQQFFNAYASNSNMACKIALQQLEGKKDFTSQLLLAKGYSAAAGVALGNQEEDLAGDLLDKAAILTKQLLKENSESAEANALLSSVYGMKIGLSPIKGMILGSKSSSAAQKGITLAPDNAFTNYVKGTNLFYTPSMFGGDAEKSVEYLEKARTIYEKNNQTKNWEYLATMALLGQAYHSQENYEKAKSIYETALQVAPNYGYIKKYLLPRTEKAKS